MNIAYPNDKQGGLSLDQLPTLAAELEEKTKLLAEGPSDDVPLYGTATRVVWLTGAIAHLRRVERQRSENLVEIQASILAGKLLVWASEPRRKLTICGSNDEL